MKIKMKKSDVPITQLMADGSCCSDTRKSSSRWPKGVPPTRRVPHPNSYRKHNMYVCYKLKCVYVFIVRTQVCVCFQIGVYGRYCTGKGSKSSIVITSWVVLFLQIFYAFASKAYVMVCCVKVIDILASYEEQNHQHRYIMHGNIPSGLFTCECFPICCVYGCASLE